MAMKNLLLFTTMLCTSCLVHETYPTSPEVTSTEPTIPTLAEDAGIQEQSFFFVWNRIHETYPYEDMRGIDWIGAYWDQYEGVLATTSAEELRPHIAELLTVLGESHFVLYPGSAYEATQSSRSEAQRDTRGKIGIDVRIIEGRSLVTYVEPDSTAAGAGAALAAAFATAAS